MALSYLLLHGNQATSLHVKLEIRTYLASLDIFNVWLAAFSVSVFDAARNEWTKTFFFNGTEMRRYLDIFTRLEKNAMWRDAWIKKKKSKRKASALPSNTQMFCFGHGSTFTVQLLDQSDLSSPRVLAEIPPPSPPPSPAAPKSGRSNHASEKNPRNHLCTGPNENGSQRLFEGSLRNEKRLFVRV